MKPRNVPPGVMLRLALVNGGLPVRPLLTPEVWVQPAKLVFSKPPLVKIAQAGVAARAKAAIAIVRFITVGPPQVEMIRRAAG